VLEGDVQCQHIEAYNVNEPGSPRYRDVIARADWHIALCRSCAEGRLEEALRSSRRFGLFIGPLIVGLAVLGAVMVGGIAARLGGGGPFLLLFLIGCAGVALVGIIMIPVGLYSSAKANAKLGRLRSEGDRYAPDDEDKWDMIDTEARRIVDCLESGKRDFVGDFFLPKGRPRNLGMSESTLSYDIVEKSGQRFRADDIIEITFHHGWNASPSDPDSMNTWNVKAPHIAPELLQLLRIGDALNLRDSYGERSERGQYHCLEIVTEHGTKKVEIHGLGVFSQFVRSTEESRRAIRLMCALEEYFKPAEKNPGGHERPGER
jgi:hypothetical protein